MTAEQGPLAGLRVIELAGMGPAPFAAMMLADLGAEVVRIDRPGAVLGPDLILNRNRRSVVLDLKDPRGAQAVLTMIEGADVLLEGFRPGVAERLGLGPEHCLQRNPALVYGRMTGWGQDGPLAATAGHDIDYIARTGLLHAIGSVGGPPQVPLNVVGDFGGGGMLLAFGVMAALWERYRSGQGQVVDAAIVDGVASLLAMQYGFLAHGRWNDERGTNLLDSGAPQYTVYETSDGRWMAVGAVEPQFYAQLVDKLRLTGLPDRADSANWPEIRRAIAQRFLERTASEWESIFDGADACVAPVRSLSEAPTDPHLAARGTYVEANGVIQPGVSPRFSRTSSSQPLPAPQPGSHTRSTLVDWGVGDVEDLISAGVARQLD
ncbi:CaiB/BaiF CoA transferase family protein [Mycolicibacterium vinylchloridicum]|uniref:CaiB/BaiF CoA transferase family protein n=1 Tax=Mycolicibacterium vinylchloridicum TaxID=2736928 RepID=UPI0015C7EC07|nr:CaiB/BaiF CoA-transferase family protein [Mycolicibacterium vinylchloridicum]